MSEVLIYKMSKMIENLLEKGVYPQKAIAELIESGKKLDSKKAYMLYGVPFVDPYDNLIKGIESLIGVPKDFNEGLSYVKNQQQNIDPKKFTAPLTEAITAYVNDAPKDLATLIDTQAYKNFTAINKDTFSKIPLSEKIDLVKEIKPNDLKKHLESLKEMLANADHATEADKMWKDEKTGEVTGTGKAILDEINSIVEVLESMKKQIDKEVKKPILNLMETVKNFEEALNTANPFAFLNTLNQEIASIRNLNNLTAVLHNLATEKTI